METPRKAIFKRAARSGQDTYVYVHDFGFDANSDAIAIVEHEDGNLTTVYIESLKFLKPPFVEKTEGVVFSIKNELKSL